MKLTANGFGLGSQEYKILNNKKMENTFENALDYINHLKQINPTALSDDKTLASAFMSYSAKTNILDRNLLKSFAEKFRQWQRKWDLFGKQEWPKKPPHLDKFIDSLISDGVSS